MPDRLSFGWKRTTDIGQATTWVSGVFAEVKVHTPSTQSLIL
ncbi:hypothetical protein ACIRP7_05830 [Streptomyces sp. NPDC102270]